MGAIKSEPTQAGDNQLSGTLGNELAKLHYKLALGPNRLSGSLPTELPGLSELDVASNRFSGSLPTALQSLRAIDLTNNRLTYDEATTSNTIASLQCRSSCLGLPPASCTAFQTRMFPAEHTEFVCVPCDENDRTTLLLTFSAIAVVFLGLLTLYVWVVLHRPHVFHRWVSTLTIFFNHVQTFTALFSLGLECPRLFEVAFVRSATSVRLRHLHPQQPYSLPPAQHHATRSSPSEDPARP